MLEEFCLWNLVAKIILKTNEELSKQIYFQTFQIFLTLYNCVYNLSNIFN